MKKGKAVLASIASVLVVAAFVSVPSYATDRNEKLVPSESQEVDECNTRFVAAPAKYYMDVSESQEVDTSGPRFIAAPAKYYMDVSQSQEVDISSPGFVAAPAKYYMDVSQSQEVDITICARTSGN